MRQSSAASERRSCTSAIRQASRAGPARVQDESHLPFDECESRSTYASLDFSFTSSPAGQITGKQNRTFVRFRQAFGGRLGGSRVAFATRTALTRQEFPHPALKRHLLPCAGEGSCSYPRPFRRARVAPQRRVRVV